MTAGAVLVLGATGAIGRGVVAAAAQAGRPVIAVARDLEALRRLRGAHPAADIVALPGSVSTDADAAALAQRLARPFDAVVAAICGRPARGRVLEQPADFLRRRIDEDLLPHLFAARHLLPLLAARGNGHYVLVGGPGAEQPWAGYGHRSIGAAALRMLARVLNDEARTLPVRVQLLAVDSPACTEANEQHADSQWPSALAIGRRALALALDPPACAPVPPIVAYASAPSASAPSQTRQQGRALLRALTLPHPLPHPHPLPLPDQESPLP